MFPKIIMAIQCWSYFLFLSTCWRKKNCLIVFIWNICKRRKTKIANYRCFIPRWGLLVSLFFLLFRELDIARCYCCFWCSVINIFLPATSSFIPSAWPLHCSMAYHTMPRYDYDLSVIKYFFRNRLVFFDGTFSLCYLLCVTFTYYSPSN